MSRNAFNVKVCNNARLCWLTASTDQMCVQVLKDTCLIEAFNLKAAIEYNMKSFAAAREALADAPPRTEEELDPV